MGRLRSAGFGSADLDVSGRAASNDHFYDMLEPFDAFDGFVDFAAYAALPDDWSVIISDVAGSTQAIREGNYKNVNMVGAASIMAVLNVRGGLEVPFVFGGDGATLAVPAALKAAACDALLALQAASRAMFGLELRVGVVAMSELRAGGEDVTVRKHRLSPGNHLAMFAGGGVELAERLIKGAPDEAGYRLTAPPGMAPPDLGGLSCRWDPLRPTRGRMMNLLIEATSDDPLEEGRELTAVMAGIGAILGQDVAASAPASKGSMTFRWPPRGLMVEARATAGGKPVWRRYAEVLLSSLLQLWAERRGRKVGPYDAPAYGRELRSNTDFRKFDGMFRGVLDVSPAQATAIEALLEDGYRDGRLVYGVHAADEALMTCLVFDMAGSEHVHFVDCAGGGFAMAAIGLKARIKDQAAANADGSDETGLTPTAY